MRGTTPGNLIALSSPAKMVSIICVVVLLVCPSLILAGHSAHKINHFLSDEYINRINSVQSSWRAGRNFDPTTSVETIKRLIGKPHLKDIEAANLPPRKTEDPAWPKKEDIPETFDARSKWGKMCPRIKEIQDQGPCGSYWAVAAASAASDRHCIGSDGQFQGQLSAQYILSCCIWCGYGCDGGISGYVWSFLSRNGGVTGGAYNSSEGCQPYLLQPCDHRGDSKVYPNCESFPDEDPKCQTECYNKQYKTPFEKDFRKNKHPYFVFGVEDIQKDLMVNGPLTMSLKLYADFFSYKSGVYKSDLKDLLGHHVVRLIGWGKEDGWPYWLVANSWNKNWGDQGLMKIRRGSNHIDIEWGAMAGVSQDY